MSIKHEVNRWDVLALYAQAYAMECQGLLAALEEMIIKELLTPENAATFYHDSVLFASNKVSKACEDMLAKNIDQVLKTDSDVQLLVKLPFEYIWRLCSSDHICLSKEQALVDFI